MSAITTTNLLDGTITYNAFTFGSVEDNSSLPPEYSIQSSFVYDETGRVVKYVKNVLSVSCIFSAETEAEMAAAITEAQRKLSIPRKKLILEQTGFSGVGTVLDWSPKPLGFSWKPFGQLSWQCVWQIEYCTSSCDYDQNVLAFSALNFDTTWSNDYEGITTRTISGHVDINIVVDKANIKRPLAIADQVRDKIKIECPKHFKQLHNVWKESARKDRLTFTVVHQAEAGEALPPGCTSVEGFVGYDSVGPGFNKASISMGMVIRTSPSYPSSLAGTIFMNAAKTKQQNIEKGVDRKAVVIPRQLSLKNLKYEQSRVTIASIAWDVTKSLGSLIQSAGIWTPITPNKYDEWRTSIENLWGNRGASLIGGSQLQSDINESTVVLYCNGTTEATIGSTPSKIPEKSSSSKFTFDCSNIPSDGGWLEFDKRVIVLREDPQTWHSKALEYLPTPGSTSQSSSPSGKVPVGGPEYSLSSEEQHDVEYHGRPWIYIALQFKGLRVVHKPTIPELQSVDGNPLYFVKQYIDGPRLAYDSYCPTWFVRGYRIYKVNGSLKDIKGVESETSISNSNGLEKSL